MIASSRVFLHNTLLFAAVTHFLGHGTYGVAIPSFAGPFIAYGDRFYMCDQRLPWRWNVRVTHFNPQKPKEAQLVTGNITGSTILSDKSWAKVVMDVRSNNAWKENAFIFNFKDKACSTLKKHIPDFANAFFPDLRNKTPCSIGPGLWEVNKKPINWRFPAVPVMTYGNYRFRVMAGNSQGKDMCFVVECFVIPMT